MRVIGPIHGRRRRASRQTTTLVRTLRVGAVVVVVVIIVVVVVVVVVAVAVAVASAAVVIAVTPKTD